MERTDRQPELNGAEQVPQAPSLMVGIFVGFIPATSDATPAILLLFSPFPLGFLVFGQLRGAAAADWRDGFAGFHGDAGGMS